VPTFLQTLDCARKWHNIAVIEVFWLYCTAVCCNEEKNSVLTQYTKDVSTRLVRRCNAEGVFRAVSYTARHVALVVDATDVIWKFNVDMRCLDVRVVATRTARPAIRKQTGLALACECGSLLGVQPRVPCTHGQHCVCFRVDSLILHVLVYVNWVYARRERLVSHLLTCLCMMRAEESVRQLFVVVQAAVLRACVTCTVRTAPRLGRQMAARN
jgi:hypothetical protein